MTDSVGRSDRCSAEQADLVRVDEITVDDTHSVHHGSRVCSIDPNTRTAWLCDLQMRTDSTITYRSCRCDMRVSVDT